MIKLVILNLLIFGFTLTPLNSDFTRNMDPVNSELNDDYNCTSLFLDLALGRIDFEEYNLLYNPRCSVNLQCPEGADFSEVGCSGPADGGCSSDEDSVTCDAQTTSCYCEPTEPCESPD